MKFRLGRKENASHVEVEEHNAISSSVTSERPGNYLFKIESFSLLRESLTNFKLDKCDSSEFETGGHKWKISVYPNGDKKRGGDGYISLYLALADPKSLLEGDEINTLIKFFVFDDLRRTYLVLQDGKQKQFHALKTELGFAKLLPLNIFNDPSRGYLVDDCCVFGVELFFHKKETKVGPTLSLKNNLLPQDNTFTWKIGQFSTLPDLHYSDVFSIGGREWSLHLYPKGYSRVKDKSLSLFLNLHDHSCLPRGWNIYAECKLRIFDQLENKHRELTVNRWFSENTVSWGYQDFMKLCDLRSESRGFIVKDSVLIKATFMSLFGHTSLP